ncbi:hypothetical protein DSM43518_05524 [Mycobacterium marinum]|uniref:Uncharacterized protein n=1 Tax=Mycobacterium shottsii TaxID=133549 RepID=A0A7I7LLM1_9MYCO|nr:MULTISPECIES: hypothetical protein [Mycobacterium ulcerans group]AXN43142.1 hypothetical protein MM1218R_01192 [Mycobacterium marinum]AXN48603.1 hypothetical protein CCUG20998_01184 [Mycobacterium marinum]EPQ70433.1 hypothetical protein MMEU_4872 [Mycobacterium marinum str. Europe]QYL30264.1 hypothetical protein TM48_04844 [Mycobacterium shottsii]RFZ01567.1 hypothetical protein DSM43518_05524 [Mycobacterium marinum]
MVSLPDHINMRPDGVRAAAVLTARSREAVRSALAAVASKLTPAASGEDDPMLMARGAERC